MGLGYGIGANLCYYAISTQGSSYFNPKTQSKQYKAANTYLQLGLALAQIFPAFTYTYSTRDGNWQNALQFSATLLFVIGYAALTGIEALAKSQSISGKIH